MSYLVESLAGTGKAYIAAQVREKGGRAHFQVSCPTVNRSYGWAFDLPLDGFSPLTALKLSGASLVPSLAGTGRMYLPVQIRPYPGGVLHVQAGSEAAIGACPERRAYGVATNIPAPSEVLAQAASLIVIGE